MWSCISISSHLAFYSSMGPLQLKCDHLIPNLVPYLNFSPFILRVQSSWTMGVLFLFFVQFILLPTLINRVQVCNFLSPNQFIFDTLIKLLTIYFEGPKFMELQGFFHKSFVFPIWTTNYEIKPILGLQFCWSAQMVMWPLGWIVETLIELPHWKIILGYPPFELGACIFRF
jgi:hypothetical protein